MIRVVAKPNVTCTLKGAPRDLVFVGLDQKQINVRTTTSAAQPLVTVTSDKPAAAYVKIPKSPARPQQDVRELRFILPGDGPDRAMAVKWRLPITDDLEVGHFMDLVS